MGKKLTKELLKELVTKWLAEQANDKDINAPGPTSDATIQEIVKAGADRSYAMGRYYAKGECIIDLLKLCVESEDD